jgi:hypothetical protein
VVSEKVIEVYSLLALNLVRWPRVLHLKIPNVHTCGRDTVKRKVREEQEKEEVVDLPSPS